jgi:hypothetical protein
LIHLSKDVRHPSENDDHRFRAIAERDPACAALAFDAIGLVEVLDVGADDLSRGHVRPPHVQVRVGHAAATPPPTACVVPDRERLDRRWHVNSTR